MLERRRSERVESLLDDPESNPELARALAARSGLYVPLLHRDRAVGVLSAYDKRGSDGRFSNDDQRLAETLATRAATAVDLSQRVSRDSLRRVVEAQELERKRLARELHDETGQALTSILLGLRSLGEGPATAEIRELVVSTLQDVRRLAVELRPKALDDFGLVPGARAPPRHLPRADRDGGGARGADRGRSVSLPRSRRRSTASSRRRSRTS